MRGNKTLMRLLQMDLDILQKLNRQLVLIAFHKE